MTIEESLRHDAVDAEPEGLSIFTAIIKQELRNAFQGRLTVGAIFKQIRDNDLYEGGGHKKFEAYCRREFEIPPRLARQMIGEAEVAILLGKIEDESPA